jgi:hypothetical protein
MLKRNPRDFVILLLAIACLVQWFAVQNTNQRLTSNVQAQVTNRVMNVGKWCNAIVDTDKALIAYVAGFPRSRPLILPRLDCTALETATQKSSTH